MFKRLPESEAQLNAHPVALLVNGMEVMCREGDSVAAALFAAGLLDCRDTPVKGVPRGPFCMMGVCFDCLVEINGMPNQQGCMVLAKPGMNIQRQLGAREVQA